MEFQNTVTRCRAFLIIVKMMNVINIRVKLFLRLRDFLKRVGGRIKFGQGPRAAPGPLVGHP